MYRKITDLALGGWWRTGPAARPSSARSDARATAPNPLAERTSRSRRDRGVRPSSVPVGELFGVEQRVGQARPPFHVGIRLAPPAGLTGNEVDAGDDLGVVRVAAERRAVHGGDPVRRAAVGGTRGLRPHLRLLVDERVVHQ